MSWELGIMVMRGGAKHGPRRTGSSVILICTCQNDRKHVAPSSPDPSCQHLWMLVEFWPQMARRRGPPLPHHHQHHHHNRQPLWAVASEASAETTLSATEVPSIGKFSQIIVYIYLKTESLVSRVIGTPLELNF